MLAAFMAICTFSVVFYVNIIRPRIRLRALEHPVDAYFVIPSQLAHGCDFAIQNEDDHLTKAITLPSQCDSLVDLVLFPRLPL
jgi:hypothetical protein